jgi:hypothetical protein
MKENKGSVQLISRETANHLTSASLPRSQRGALSRSKPLLRLGSSGKVFDDAEINLDHNFDQQTLKVANHT